jgi:hypothetical protein
LRETHADQTQPEDEVSRGHKKWGRPRNAGPIELVYAAGGAGCCDVGGPPAAGGAPAKIAASLVFSAVKVVVLARCAAVAVLSAVI